MIRKCIIYLAGLACALLLLSFTGCQSVHETPTEEASMESTMTLTEEAEAPSSLSESSIMEESTEETSVEESTVLPETTTEEVITTPEETVPTTEETIPVIDAENLIDISTTLYTYDKMEQDLHTLAAAYPDLMTLSAPGSTADGRALYQVTFGNPKAPRQIFLCAATHGREYMTTQLLMKQLAHYCAAYHTGSYDGIPYERIFDEICFVLVPMVNPDGVTISQLGLEGLRSAELRDHVQNIYQSDLDHGYTSYDLPTYLTRWKANACGVDLNRNYSPGWESVNERSQPSSDFYKGSAPGDQLEAYAMMSVINSLSDPILALSYHSYGALVYWQYGQPEPLWSVNEQLAAKISALTGYYLAGYSNEAGFSNWCVREKGIPSVTVETGTVPTPLPIDQFASLWAQNQDMWVMLGRSYLEQ